MNDIFDSFPVMHLDQIILRKISANDDYLNYFNYMNHPKVAAYLSNEDLPHSPESAKTELHYWARLFDYRSCFYWAIALKDSNKMIGTCGFNHWNKGQRRSEISYDLDHEYWGRGIMTKAVTAITDFGIKDMNLQRIQATVAIDNLPSIKMLEKISFHRESLLKRYGVLHGESKDFYMYTKINNKDQQ